MAFLAYISEILYPKINIPPPPNINREYPSLLFSIELKNVYTYTSTLYWFLPSTQEIYQVIRSHFYHVNCAFILG
jgi:hypothetical protein